MTRSRFHIEKRMVVVNNVPIYYQWAGSDTAHEPIVLVHGLSGSTRWWIRNVESLARFRRVYLVDLPGFGSMSRARTRFALAQAGSWLVAWMHAVGIQHADLIGHSMGGYICIWIAAHHPELVSRLVLVSPAVMPQVRSVLGYAVPLLTSLRYLSPGFFLILAHDALRAGPLTLLHAANDILHGDVQNEIHTIAVPTLLIWGANDTLVPPGVGYILRHELADARLLILQRAAHVSMFDQPGQFNAAVNAFLRGDIVGE